MAGEDDSLINHTFALGDLVWAKIKWSQPWPGVIAGTKDSKPNKGEKLMLIYFFGSKNYSWVITKNLKPYVPKRLDLSKCRKLFRDAYAAIKDVYENGKLSKFHPQYNTLFDRLVSDAPTKTHEPSTSKAKTSTKKSPAVKKSNKASAVSAKKSPLVKKSNRARAVSAKKSPAVKKSYRARAVGAKKSPAVKKSNKARAVGVKKSPAVKKSNRARAVGAKKSPAVKKSYRARAVGAKKSPAVKKSNKARAVGAKKSPAVKKSNRASAVGAKKSPAVKKSNRARAVGAAWDVSKVSESGKKRGKNFRRGKISKGSEESDAIKASSEEKIVVKPKKRSSTWAVSEAKRIRTQHSDADATIPSGGTSCLYSDSPAPTPRRTMTVNPLLDRPSLVCPESVQLNVSKVSQTLLQKNIIPSKLQLGFIGLGNMGSGIVTNLLHSGHRVVIWNRTSEKTKEFIKAGAKVAETSQDVVKMADITFSCVSDTQAAKDVMFGYCSALDVINETKAYVEMSTIDAETSKLLSDAVTSRGGRYLEAQLQGSRREAKEGNLLILSAGDASLYSSCQSCFEAIGRCSFFFGEVGSATKMNLVMQLMSGFFLAGFAEALALGDKLGLHLADVLEVLDLTKFSNPFIKEKGKSIINCSFRTDHALQLMQKDLGLVIKMSQTVDQPVPLAAVTNELYKRAQRLGYGDHDSSAVFVGTRF